MKAFLSLLSFLFFLIVPASAKTFVLVHGAFEDASVSRAVVKQLQRHGHEVIAVSLPGRPSNRLARMR